MSTIHNAKRSKVFVLGPGENWVVDRFVREWIIYNSDISVFHPLDADVIWVLADWCFDRLKRFDLSKKRVITTVHHIVPDKFGSAELSTFYERDSVTSAYHVYNFRTREQVAAMTSKRVQLITYWANQNMWKRTSDKLSLREKYGIPLDAYVVGSFQRDTEGKDLISPKLEKGPDLLCNYIEYLCRIKSNVHVLLAGWRRQYVISRLVKAGISYTYIELPPHDVINELYQTLDLYPVSARHEGGPQSLIECGLLGVPVVSRPVGIAEQVLIDTSIKDDLCDAVPSIPNVSNWHMPIAFLAYRDFLLSDDA